MAHPLRDGRIDRVLAHIALHPEIICPRPLIFFQRTPLHLVLMRRIPRPQDDFAAAAHGLRVRGHHADGAEVVQHVFGRNGLGADARFGEGDVFRNVAREVVADHEHVEVLVEGVEGVGARGVRAAGQDIRVLDDGDDVWRVAATRAFGMVSMNSAAGDGFDGLFDEAGFVERVGVDEALHIVFVADTQARVDGGGRGAPVFVQLEAHGAGDALLLQAALAAVVAFARDAEVEG